MAAITSTVSASGSRASHNPGSSATVMEYMCLFTHDLRRKQKRWQDGRIKFHTFNKRLMVHDDRGNYIGDSHWRSDWEFGEGEEVQLERGGVIVQVNECVGSQTQDLSELVDKRVQEKEQRQANMAARSNTVTPARAPVPPHRTQTPADHFQVRHLALNRVLGTTPTHLGRAHVPTESPFEQRNKGGDGKSNERPQKRTRYDDSSSGKAGYAKNLFGATLSLSGGSQSSAPVRRQPASQPLLTTSSRAEQHGEPASSPPEEPNTSGRGDMGFGSLTRPRNISYPSNQANGGPTRAQSRTGISRVGNQDTGAHSDVVDLCSSSESATARPAPVQASKRTANQQSRGDHVDDGQSSRPTAKRVASGPASLGGVTSRQNAVRKPRKKRKARENAGAQEEQASGDVDDAEVSASQFPAAVRKPLSAGITVANRIARERPKKNDHKKPGPRGARARLHGDEEQEERQPLFPPPKELTGDASLQNNDQAGLANEKKTKLRLQSRKRKGMLVVHEAVTKKRIIADDGDGGDGSDTGFQTAEEEFRSRPHSPDPVQDSSPRVSHPPEVLELPEPVQDAPPHVSSSPAAVQKEPAPFQDIADMDGFSSLAEDDLLGAVGDGPSPLAECADTGLDAAVYHAPSRHSLDFGSDGNLLPLKRPDPVQYEKPHVSSFPPAAVRKEPAPLQDMADVDVFSSLAEDDLLGAVGDGPSPAESANPELDAAVDDEPSHRSHTDSGSDGNRSPFSPPIVEVQNQPSSTPQPGDADQVDTTEKQVDKAEDDILDASGVNATTVEQPPLQHETPTSFPDDNAFSSSSPRSEPAVHRNLDGEETPTATKCKKAVLPWKRAPEKERRAEDVYDFPLTSADESQAATLAGNEGDDDDDGHVVVHRRKTNPSHPSTTGKKSQTTNPIATEDSDSEPLPVNRRTGKAPRRKNRAALEDSQSSEAGDDSGSRSRIVKKRPSRTDEPREYGNPEDSEASDAPIPQAKGAKTKKRAVRTRSRNDRDDEPLAQSGKTRPNKASSRKRRSAQEDSECSEAESAQTSRVSSRTRKRPAKKKRRPEGDDGGVNVGQLRLSKIKDSVRSKSIVGFAVDPDILERFNRSTFGKVVSHDHPTFVSQEAVVSPELVVSQESVPPEVVVSPQPSVSEPVVSEPVVSQESIMSQGAAVSPEPVVSQESVMFQESLVPGESVDNQANEPVVEMDKTVDAHQSQGTKSSQDVACQKSTDIEAAERVNDASPPDDRSTTGPENAHAKVGMEMTAAVTGAVEKCPATRPQADTEISSASWSDPDQNPKPGVPAVAVPHPSPPASPSRQHTRDTDEAHQPDASEVVSPKSLLPVEAREAAPLSRPSVAAGTALARDGTKAPPRIVNPATRGRKAALKTDAAGKTPQPVLPPELLQAFQPPARISVPKPAVKEESGPVERPRRGMRFPGFAPVSARGPWSREAHDLLGMDGAE